VLQAKSKKRIESKTNKLLNINSRWKEDLCKPPRSPQIKLESMSKRHLLSILLLYYVLFILFMSLGILVKALFTNQSFTSFNRSCQVLTECQTLFPVHGEISPLTSAFSITLEFENEIQVNMSLNALQAHIYAYPAEIKLRQIESVNFELVESTYTPQTNSIRDTFQSDLIKVKYDILFQNKIDFQERDIYFDMISIDIDWPSGMNVSAANQVITVSSLFNAPWLCTFIGAMLTFINLAFFAYLKYHTKNVKQNLIQWKWIQLMLMFLVLWTQLPYSIIQYAFIVAGNALPKYVQEIAFWTRAIGKSGCSYMVLLFADGMSITDGVNKKFYSYKILLPLLTLALHVASYYCVNTSAAFPLLILHTTVEFFMEALYVLYLTYRSGQRVRQQPYRGALFQYTTYGLVSLLIIPTVLSAILTFVHQLLTIIIPSYYSYSWEYSTSWLTGLVRDHLFTIAIIRSYVPHTSKTSLRHKKMPVKPTGVSTNDDKPINFCLYEDSILEQRHQVFCLQTATIMLNISVSTYYDHHEAICISPSAYGILGKDISHLHEQGYDLIRHFHDPRTDTNAFLLYGLSRYVLAFRGTGSMKNGYTDIKSHQILFPGIDYSGKRIKRHHRTSVYVHSGFFGAYQAIQSQIQEAVLAALSRTHSTIYITGHSLGGALATLAAFDIALLLEKIYPLESTPVIMYNFGSPRVGNHSFASLFNEKVLGFRIINDGDVITQHPKRDYTGVSSQGIGIYKHVGTEIRTVKKTVSQEIVFKGLLLILPGLIAYLSLLQEQIY